MTVRIPPPYGNHSITCGADRISPNYKGSGSLPVCEQVADFITRHRPDPAAEVSHCLGSNIAERELHVAPGMAKNL